jgi:hypothetical protein
MALRCVNRRLRGQPTPHPSAYLKQEKNVKGAKAMTTLQAVFLGVILSWTPSIALLAFLLSLATSESVVAFVGMLGSRACVAFGSPEFAALQPALQASDAIGLNCICGLPAALHEQLAWRSEHCDTDRPK